MTYEQLKALAQVEFKRFTGVQQPTLEKIVEALGEQERDKKKRGRSPKLAVADQGLIALPYGRADRLYSPIARSWQFSAAAV